MSAPTHGDYDPSKGWYSQNTNAWHTSPDRIGLVRPAPPAPTDREREQYEDTWGRAVKFRADSSMESLIRLRESSKQEEREQFGQLAAGTTRMALADYETQKAAAEKTGA